MGFRIMGYYEVRDIVKEGTGWKNIDLGIIDPPFSIKFNGRSSAYNRKKENVLDEYNEFNIKDIPIVAADYYRSLSPNGMMCVIMGWNALPYWNMGFLEQGFHQLGHIIWKYQFGVYTKKRPVSSHYHILVFHKNPKIWTYNKQCAYDEDVWVINRPYQKGGKKYPNKLPDALVERLILTLSNRGDTVYDGFCGSGTTVKIARQLGRLSYGADIRDNTEFWDDTR